MGYTESSLTKELIDAGIKTTDTLLVHSSMKKIGIVEGGADTVLDALTSAVSSGLLVLPTLSYATVGIDNPFFSVNETPSCVGILTEIFRKRKGVYRSWHPTHSVAAYGKESESFIKGHELNSTPCSRKGPWGRLLDRKAKILFIGTGISCNTFLHGVEEWNKVPDYFTEYPEILTIITPDGKKITRGYYRHNQHTSDNYAKIEDLLFSEKVLTKFKFGDANCDLIDCYRLEQIVSEILRKDIKFFFHNRLL